MRPFVITITISDGPFALTIAFANSHLAQQSKRESLVGIQFHIGSDYSSQAIRLRWAAGITFAKWLESKIAADSTFLEEVWFSNEAHFHPTGHFNIQNWRIWTVGGNARYNAGSAFAQPKTYVLFSVLSSAGIIGSIFFLVWQQLRSNCEQGPVCDILKRFWDAVQRDQTSDADKNWFSKAQAQDPAHIEYCPPVAGEAPRWKHISRERGRDPMAPSLS